MSAITHRGFHHAGTGTWTHVFACEGDCMVVDSVLDYGAETGKTHSQSVDEIIAFIKEKSWTLKYILETHAHADHLTAAQVLKSKLGGVVVIGQGIISVQSHFADLLPLGDDFVADGSQFDRLLTEGDSLYLGDEEVRVLATPGHTNDGLTFLLGQYAVIGDTIFHPELGSARCDFPGGDAVLLYQSIEKILALPESTQLCLGHDYPSGRDAESCVTVARQKRENVHCKEPFEAKDFIAFRTKRDAQLAEPKLIKPSLIHNLKAGLF